MESHIFTLVISNHANTNEAEACKARNLSESDDFREKYDNYKPKITNSFPIIGRPLPWIADKVSS